MKKTLLGVLAFVLVLATILTGTVMAAEDSVSKDPKKAADVKKVGADTPILVDGLMDKAYADAVALEMATYDNGAEEIYTHGIARFVWSEAENALYCFVIVNDADVGPEKYDNDYQIDLPWSGDTLELFVDFTENSTAREGWGIVPAGTSLTRSFQYRINGNDGTPTCGLAEEKTAFAKAYQTQTGNEWRHPVTGKTMYAGYSTYHFNEETKQFESDLGCVLDADNNIYGWHANSDDLSKQGWGWQRTEFGYTAEFRIEATSIETPLAAGKKVLFDLQANDSYEAIRQKSCLRFYYDSTRRVATGESTAAGNCQYYDWLILSEEESNNSGSPYSLAQLEDFGMADATTSKTTVTTPRPIIKTDKVTWTRKPTSAVNTGTDTPGSGNDGGNQGGDNQGSGDNQGAGDTTGGGCGSSITVGASVAAIAMVGAAGFFAFRKKDEE